MTFEATDIESVTVVTQVNISMTPGISETWPSWSPSGDEIVVDALDISPDPDEPSTWIPDIAIYNAGGSGDPISLVKGNTNINASFGDRVDNPDWANENPEPILFGLLFDGGDWDIWCVERTLLYAINVTQHLDISDGAELNDEDPNWLPDDSGFLFSRDHGKEIVEMRFGDNYEPANGCPRPTNLASATTAVLAKGKGSKWVGHPDYWLGAP